jgi:YidC/Oxa1 family membrane protein insertase
LWSYFYPVPPPVKNPAATASPAASPAASQPATANVPAPPVSVPNLNAAPQRTVTIRTPLYDAKFDTLGAEPVSWIIKKNRYSNQDIYSVAGRKQEKKPLELISSEGLKRQPRMVPLQLQTGDAALDSALSSNTYRVEGVDASSGDVELNLGNGERKELTFVFEDANRLQVRKKIVFYAELYETVVSILF